MSVQVNSATIQVEVSGEPPLPGGCFIATACYGSPTHARVCQLRKLKNVMVNQSRIASFAYRLYYVFSPPVALKIKRMAKTKILIRNTIELLMKVIKWHGTVKSRFR